MALLILAYLFSGQAFAASSQEEQVINIAEQYFHTIYDYLDKDIFQYKALWDGSFSSQLEEELELNLMFDFTYGDEKIAFKCGDYSDYLYSESAHPFEMLDAIQKLSADQDKLCSLLPEQTIVSYSLVCGDMEISSRLATTSIKEALGKFSVVLYMAGLQVDNDTFQAYEYFLLSADLGNPNGLYEVGQSQFRDQELPFLYDEQMIMWFIKAAQAGHVESMVKLAEIFEEGLISISDRRISAYWLGKAVTHSNGKYNDEYYSKYSDIAIPTYHQSGDYEYRLNEHAEAYITMYTGTETNLVIPSTIDSYPVTGIDGHAFVWCDFNTVDIPNSVIEIGDYAFMYCYQVEKIDLPANLTRMGNNPFLSCHELQTYYISPDNPYFAVADHVLFNKKEKLLVSYPTGLQRDSYSVPEGILRIGPNAFYNTYLSMIYLPESLEYIEHDAFFSGINISTINIPTNVIEIGDRAFQRCLDLEKVTIPDHVSYLGERAFALCESLDTVDLSASLTEIKNETFEWCFLSQITIPDTVKMLGDRSFVHCSYLTAINLPNSISFIGEDCFRDCPKLMLTVVKDTYGSEYAKKNQLRYQYSDSLDWLLDENTDDATSIQIDPGITAGWDHSNAENQSEKVFCADNQTMHGVFVLPSHDSGGNQYNTLNTDSIGQQDDLFALQIPAGYKYISSKTFSGCPILRTVIIPETVTDIEDDLFDIDHGPVTFIALANSCAVQYAKSHTNIRCIELLEASMDETDKDYLTMLIYKNTPGLSDGFASHLDYMDYLSEIDNRSLVRMGLADRNDIVLGWLVDLFDSGDSKLYLADSYRSHLYQILESMQNRESVKIDFKTPKELTNFAAKAADKYLDLNAWLQETDKKALAKTDPYFAEYMKFSEELTDISKAIGNVQDTLELIQFTFRDYSESQAILDVVEGMSAFDSTGTLTKAFTHLRNEFNEGIKGIFTYLVDEKVTSYLTGFIEDGLKELFSEPFKLYSTINKMIDLGLTITGEKKIAEKEIDYVSLMNLTIYAYNYYDDLMQNGDNSPETMKKLSVLVTFIREAIIQTYKAEIELTDDNIKIADWQDSINYYEAHDDFIRYCVYGE